MGQFSKFVIKHLDEWAGIVYNGSMKTTNNVKSLGVPSEVHAKALELATLYDLKVYEVVSKALNMYAAYRASNGSDQDGAQ